MNTFDFISIFVNHPLIGLGGGKNAPARIAKFLRGKFCPKNGDSEPLSYVDGHERSFCTTNKS